MRMTIQEKIAALKAEKQALILAHYYVDGAVQAVADYVGDSYYLSQMAAQSGAKYLVFCGVAFMGESAKLLNPQATVLMPQPKADCPMAHMATPRQVQQLRLQYPDLAVVCYINSTAALKECADVCVTSANAVEIVRKLPQRTICFIPDQNLGRYVAAQLPEKEFVFVDGCCPVHQAITPQAVEQLRREHTQAMVLAHPECTPQVLELAHYTGSTTGILKAAREAEAQEYIICTEAGVLWQLEQENPGKRFYFPQPLPLCPDMKSIRLEDVLAVLEQPQAQHQVELPQSIGPGAKESLERMLELAGK